MATETYLITLRVELGRPELYDLKEMLYCLTNLFLHPEPIAFGLKSEIQSVIAVTEPPIEPASEE